jgi:hypothetical protein
MWEDFCFQSPEARALKKEFDQDPEEVKGSLPLKLKMHVDLYALCAGQNIPFIWVFCV